MDKAEHEQLYAAFKSKDSRFDGRFFVGVTSTGIYCRPICHARMPKAENCRFFSSAAAAEKEGFRPCLVCRPELAPGLSPSDAQPALAQRAARYLEENCGDNRSLEEFAARLGYSGRHLRRAFAEEYQVSPVEYRQTCRLLLAKELLTDTDLTITEIALAAGFGSLRRLNDLFQKKYHLPPSGFRQQARAGKKREVGFTVALGYRPPYAWQRIISFLALRAIPGVESVSADCYARTLRLVGKDGGSVCGWLRISPQPERNALAVTLSDSLLPVLPPALARVRQLFDLYCDPHAVQERLTAAPNGPPGFVCGLRVPGCADYFELAVRAIVGQQISVGAAGQLAGRIAQAWGRPLETGIAGLTTVFPSAEEILALEGPIENQLGPLGIIATRARAIRELARCLAEKKLDWGFGNDPPAELKKLLAIPGIGPWTAHYIAMRAWGWTDAFPDSDLGIVKALGNRPAREIRALAESWRPWRSYAAMALWDSLSKEEKR